MIVCKGCGTWNIAKANFEKETLRCTECGFEETARFLPLFVVTGPSGAGKTEVLPILRSLLPDCEVFETDLLWDSQSDWNFVQANWLRIAFSIAQSGRVTVLSGTHLPEHLDLCDYRSLFPAIHYLALIADEPELARRLRGRAAWRNCDLAFIEKQIQFARWLKENAETAFSPPLTLVDTTACSVEETSEQIRDWVQYHRQSMHGPEGREG